MTNHIEAFSFRDASNRQWSIRFDVITVGRLLKMYRTTRKAYAEYHGLPFEGRMADRATLAEYLYVIGMQDRDIGRHQIAAAIYPQLVEEYLVPLDWSMTRLPDGDVYRKARMALSMAFCSRWPIKDKSDYDWHIATYSREN